MRGNFRPHRIKYPYRGGPVTRIRVKTNIWETGGIVHCPMIRMNAIVPVSKCEPIRAANDWNHYGKHTAIESLHMPRCGDSERNSPNEKETGSHDGGRLQESKKTVGLRLATAPTRTSPFWVGGMRRENCVHGMAVECFPSLLPGKKVETELIIVKRPGLAMITLNLFKRTILRCDSRHKKSGSVFKSQSSALCYQRKFRGP